MPVVSLSLPKQMIKEMDEVQESLGFTGRSELVLEQSWRILATS